MVLVHSTTTRDFIVHNHMTWFKGHDCTLSDALGIQCVSADSACGDGLEWRQHCLFAVLLTVLPFCLCLSLRPHPHCGECDGGDGGGEKLGEVKEQSLLSDGYSIGVITLLLNTSNCSTRWWLNIRWGNYKNFKQLTFTNNDSEDHIVTSHCITIHYRPNPSHSIEDVTHTKQDSIVNYIISLDQWVADYPN